MLNLKGIPGLHSGDNSPVAKLCTDLPEGGVAWINRLEHSCEPH
jgi:hypothetical protein